MSHGLLGVVKKQGFFWRGGGGARAPPSDFFEISRGGAPPLVPPREIRRGGARGGRVVGVGDPPPYHSAPLHLPHHALASLQEVRGVGVSVAT